MFELTHRPGTNLGLSTFEEMYKLFDNFLFTGSSGRSTGLPAVDIYSNDDKHMIVEMPAPGFDANDININMREGVLEITGQKSDKEELKKDGRNYIVRESNSSLARRVVIPDGADADNIVAELDKGLLTIKVPVHRPGAKQVKFKLAKILEPKKSQPNKS